MGVGKTTVGKKLAKLLDIGFVDLDKFIESKYHKTVPELFAERGEREFRLIEQKSLIEVSEIEDVVVSTGGGTPCFFENIRLMNGIYSCGTRRTCSQVTDIENSSTHCFRKNRREPDVIHCPTPERKGAVLQSGTSYLQNRPFNHKRRYSPDR